MNEFKKYKGLLKPILHINMNKTILMTAAILGALAVILGAFAAHGLKSLISSESVNTFETGVRYQFYYALLLLFMGIQTIIKPKYSKLIYYLSLIGIILFSGSIYGLATNELTAIDFKKIAWLTPIGGVFLISVWLVMLINFSQTIRAKNRK